ncbi:MAG: FUSC family protein [Catenulispora sp.]|nr:FUSC family protein [Catenulispora sp.]
MSTNLIAIGPRRSAWRPAALRAAAVAMAATLAAYGSAIWIEHRAHLHVDIVITAVAVALTLARVQLGADLPDRAVGAVVLAASAAGASEVSSLIQRHQVLGDAAFTVAVAASIWIRRYGQRATRVGTVLVVPFVTLLVTQAQGGPPHPASYDLWSALVAAVAAFWVAVFQLGAGAFGLPEQRRRLASVPVSPAPTASPPAKRRIPASTRMACQMAVALAAAFAVGHGLFHEHWPWAVLTAFIVCSGARGRADVLHKGLLRAAGAAIGTVVATAVAGAFPPADRWSVVVIFAVLALASWLRELSYAWWAGSVTAALSLLYGYFGQSSGPLLRTRLEAILAGAALGIAASWFVLPLRTRDVLKRRVADSLAALSDFLGAPLGAPKDEHCDDQHEELRLRRDRFLHTVTLVEQIAKPLRAQRLLKLGTDHADVVDALHDCVEPVATLADALSKSSPDARQAWQPLHHAVAGNIVAVRRAIGRRPGPPYQQAVADTRTAAGTRTPAAAALSALDTALAVVNAAYAGPRES